MHEVSRAPFALATAAARSRTAPVHGPGAGTGHAAPAAASADRSAADDGDVPGGRSPPERGGRERADGEDGDQGEDQDAARPVVAATSSAAPSRHGVAGAGDPVPVLPRRTR